MGSKLSVGSWPVLMLCSTLHTMSCTPILHVPRTGGDPLLLHHPGAPDSGTYTPGPPGRADSPAELGGESCAWGFSLWACITIHCSGLVQVLGAGPLCGPGTYTVLAVRLGLVVCDRSVVCGVKPVL
jgi:hypothetical protein